MPTCSVARRGCLPNDMQFPFGDACHVMYYAIAIGMELDEHCKMPMHPLEGYDIHMPCRQMYGFALYFLTFHTHDISVSTNPPNCCRPASKYRPSTALWAWPARPRRSLPARAWPHCGRASTPPGSASRATPVSASACTSRARSPSAAPTPRPPPSSRSSPPVRPLAASALSRVTPSTSSRPR